MTDRRPMVLVPVPDAAAALAATTRDDRQLRRVDLLLAAIPDDWLVFWGGGADDWHDLMTLKRGYPLNLESPPRTSGDAILQMLRLLPGERTVVVIAGLELASKWAPSDLVEDLRRGPYEVVVEVRPSASRDPETVYVDGVPEFERAERGRRLSEWELTGLYAFASSTRLCRALEHCVYHASHEGVYLWEALGWVVGPKLARQARVCAPAEAEVA